ncbi:MAG: hypothetical protein H6644_19325 [Caldilineaceae bacterium]|nr:hypothetical protein [Caldilineaceae bacterium]
MTLEVVWRDQWLVLAGLFCVLMLLTRRGRDLIRLIRAFLSVAVVISIVLTFGADHVQQFRQIRPAVRGYRIGAAQLAASLPAAAHRRHGMRGN